MTTDAATRNNGVAVVLAVGASAVIALTFAWTMYLNTGQEAVPEGVIRTLLAAGWLGTVGAAFAVAKRLGAHQLLVVSLSLLAWPPTMFGAMITTLYAACNGWGPGPCPFS